MKTITCTNPMCGATIEVLPGTAQIACPKCLTWHFIEQEEHAPSADQPERQVDEAPPVQVDTYTMPPELDEPQHEPQKPIQEEQVSSPAPVYSTPDPEPQAPPAYSHARADQSAPIGAYDTYRPDVEQMGEPPEESSAPSMARLTAEDGVTYTLSVGINVLGRKNADIIIAKDTISRRHCVVEVIEVPSEGYEYYVYDIGHIEGRQSTNGVFLTGRSLRLQDYERIKVSAGTVIRLGHEALTLTA